MYVVFLECGGALIATDRMSTKLDEAKRHADYVASDVYTNVRVTVRHHKNRGEVYYDRQGTINTSATQ